MNRKGVSIAVCCYNSAHRLPETLKHLAEQVIRHDLACEVIVVDNASKDGTPVVVRDTWKNLSVSFPLRIVVEENPGLSNARKKAVLEATFEYILFCDDDNWLAKDYVQKAYDRMESDDRMGILGGRGIPVFESKPPAWFESVSKSYAVGKQVEKSSYLPDGHYLYGAGMILRKSVLTRLYEGGIENLLTGRKGDSLTLGEDIEIGFWFRAMGYALYYDDELVFSHFIPSQRLTEQYFLNRTIAKGNSEAIFAIYRQLAQGQQEIRWLNYKYFWYLEILKRLFYFIMIKIKSTVSFEDKMKAEFLWSSVRFRNSNYDYLKDCSLRIKYYLDFCKQ